MAKIIKSDPMPRVLAKVLCPVNHVALASEVVNAVRNALRVYILLGTGSEIFLFFKTVGLFDAIFKHSSRLLTQRRMLFVVRLGVLFPEVSYDTHIN